MRIRQRASVSLLFSMTVAFGAGALLASPALAQGSSRPTPLERRVEHLDRQRDQYDRDNMRNNTPGKSGKPQKPSAAVMLQVKEDFERLQATYNDIVSAMTAGADVPHKFILDKTVEINKCAHRLKKNLTLPEPVDASDKKSEGELTDEQFKPTLQALCRHIASFVTNPLFETPGVLDVEQSTKASKDLRDILELSEALSRSAAKVSGAKN